MPNRPYLGRTVDDTIAMYKPHVSGTEGAVSSNSPYATQAGLEIMKQGGNAFDAAVAVSLVLGVVEPYHCGIGGGSFHTFYDKNTNEFYCVDARGIAPKNAYQDMMLDENGDVDLNLTEYSGRSVSVPSFYRAMDNLLKKHGTMTWEQVSAPAIKLCRDGFACGFAYARITDTPEAEHNKAEYEGFEELYLNHGKPRQFGEIIKNPDLADTMEGVAKNGVDWFYNGPIADEMVEHINKNKGLFCKEDLINCKPKERIPVRGNYRGYDIISMAPPSSGGTHIIQMLNILENFDLKGMGFHSADSTHVIAETMKMMFADRSVAMGDPDFVDVKVDKLLSKEYAKELAAKIDMDHAKEYAPTDGIEGCDPGKRIHYEQRNGRLQCKSRCPYHTGTGIWNGKCDPSRKNSVIQYVPTNRHERRKTGIIRWRSWWSAYHYKYPAAHYQQPGLRHDDGFCSKTSAYVLSDIKSGT